ncbi:MAG: cytochrome c oxidase subunit 3 [Planctomycetota bacterium]
MSEAAAHGDDHGHGDHDHLPFLAHHFDDPEQQYDSGKLGMWLFLVTEILFFSGMFCAYALYRSIHPEVWTFASQYLNATLGAINTGVLLFSSLTMAWGVRCAQLRQRTGLVVCLAMTLGCASMFLGVKAIEYTHKWELGLLPAGSYESQYLHTSIHHGISDWLYVLSAVPALCVVGFTVWYGYCLSKGQKENSEVAGSLLVTALCYFAGVGLGIFLESGGDHGGDHGGAHAAEHSTDHGDGHDDHGHAEDAHEHEGDPGHSEHGDDEKHSVLNPNANVVFVSTEVEETSVFKPGAASEKQVDQRGGAGLFFSIYYCMTGVHAIHILAGMGVLTWLLVRATRDHFNEQYFGPVDYVGLYWHIVDLIWIYLFPLLYLIK